MHVRDARYRWLAILAAAGIYFGAARIGFALAFVNGTVSAVWPPTGFALALLLLGGRKLWPAILLGECAADLANGSPLLLSLAFAVGSTCEALAGYGLLQLAGFRSTLDRARDVFALLGLAALCSTLVSATIGTVALLAAGTITIADAWATWHVWWLGDVTGDVIVAPLLLVLATTRIHRIHGWRVAEAGAFTLSLAVLAAVAHQLTLGIAYLVLPVLIWAALRFRQQGAVVANIVLAGVGVIAAAGAGSQLARVSIAQRVLFTQNFVAVGAITTLVLAAVIAERDRAAAALRRSQADAQALMEERAALGEIATAIARETEPEQIFALIAERAARLIGAAGAVVIHADSVATPTVAAAWAREGVPFFVTGSPFPLTPSSATAAALRTGRTARIEAASSAQLGARMATPIRAGHTIWGTIAAAAATDAALPDRSDRLLERIADLAGLAIVSAEARDRLLTEATTDPLTGLANHRVFQRRLAEEAERSSRYGRPLTVALADLDAFKTINDTAGHLAGDRVLIEVARRITSVLPEGALVARLGGDEFALLLPECDGIEAYTTAERAWAAVSATPIEGYGPVSVSVGVADMAQSADRDELLQLADIALYAAKMQGRDSCVRYSPRLEPEPSPSLPVQDVRSRTLSGLHSLALAIDAKDPGTVEHSKRVAELAVALARARGWAPAAIELLRDAALVHDVGKIGVPDAVLFAPRGLDPQEREQVKRHAALGAQLAADVLGDDQVRWIRWHHERADGHGYPDGLTENELPEGAKLLAMADAWDAMTTARSYSPAKSVTAALAECESLAGSQFALEAVAALREAVAQRSLVAV